MPLADDLRPKKIEDIIGQEHLLGSDALLTNLLKNKDHFFPNILMIGPPGVGKTSLSEVICKELNFDFIKLNATIAKTADIDNAIKQIGTLGNTNGVVLYIDELHRFKRDTQQKLLDYVEKGTIKLIGSTTENPYHYIQKGLVSRCTIIELKPLSPKDITNGLPRGVKELNKSEFLNLEINDNALEYIAELSNGDMRTAFNILEVVAYSTPPNKEGISFVDTDRINKLSFSKHINFDKDGDSHYDILSAFQKSIRGSDPDASLHYLARLIKGGDLASICRRLLVIASEDCFAYPNAITIVKACTDTAKEVGFPEARLALAHATVLLSTSPKSSALLIAIDSALNDIDTKFISDIPDHLKDSHYSGAKKLGRGTEYLYPHNYTHNYIPQQYLPDSIIDAVYYIPQNNKSENNIKKHLDFLKTIK